MKITLDITAADHAKLVKLFEHVRGFVHHVTLIEYASDVLSLGIEAAQNAHFREIDRGEVCPFDTKGNGDA